jgi:hypothetical protein
LSVQVDQMTSALGRAQTSAVTSAQSLESLTGRAEEVARRLELLVASMHDIADAEPARRAEPVEAAALFHSRRADAREVAG